MKFEVEEYPHEKVRVETSYCDAMTCNEMMFQIVVAGTRFVVENYLVSRDAAEVYIANNLDEAGILHTAFEAKKEASSEYSIKLGEIHLDTQKKFDNLKYIKSQVRGLGVVIESCDSEEYF